MKQIDHLTLGSGQILSWVVALASLRFVENKFSFPVFWAEIDGDDAWIYIGP